MRPSRPPHGALEPDSSPGFRVPDCRSRSDETKNGKCAVRCEGKDVPIEDGDCPGDDRPTCCEVQDMQAVFDTYVDIILTKEVRRVISFEHSTPEYTTVTSNTDT